VIVVVAAVVVVVVAAAAAAAATASPSNPSLLGDTKAVAEGVSAERRRRG